MKKLIGVAVCALVLGSSWANAEEVAPVPPVAEGHGEAATSTEAHGAGSEGEHSATAPAAADDASHDEDEAAHQWAATRTPMPFDVMRSVEFLQDQVARGNDRAIRVQALLLRRFGRAFLEADPAVWQDPRNARAAVLFALSGGTPDVLDRLIREKLLDEAQQPLLEGALAYVRNDLKKAREKFSKVNFAGMEPVLAAQLSLAMGQIDQIDHPADAITQLDRARLLAPGTLIEEAALRLGALLVDQTGDHAQADHLARRYFDRYADSTYASNFEARFSAMMTARAKGKAAETLASMADVTASLPDARRQRLLLASARRSLVEGDLLFANATAGAALAIPGLSDPDKDRATLYETASSLGTLPSPEARKRLDALPRDELHPEDEKLLDAAYAVLDSIDATVAQMPANAGSQTAENAAPSVPPLLARAEAALAGSSQMLRP